MRSLFAFVLPFLPLVASCKTAEALPSTPSGPGFAVVELFTSEGCSSCPPADEVLASWVRKNDAHVYPLSFHVDYWDELGWVDPFSSAAATSRQREYATSLGTKSLYTPQMVVGGTEAFVGSDSPRAREAVARAVARSSSTHLTITSERADAQSLRVRYRVEPPAADVVLRIALVERTLVTHVPRGENAGKTLEHENVVRSFVTVPLRAAEGTGPNRAAEGTATIAIPSAVDRRHVEVIGYVQSAARPDGRGMPITAAARAAVPQT